MTALTQQLERLRLLVPPGRALALALALVVGSMLAGLYVQHVAGLVPCPLCVLQRIAYVATGVFAGIGAFVLRGRIGRFLSATLALLAALAGGGVAAWHNWIIAYPPESLSCGRPFEWFHRDFPLAVWLPRLFRGDGDCLDVSWTLLGLTVPGWSLVVFAALVLMTGWAVFAAWRQR
jgi:disulfide bond formation protein DsbB